MAIIDNKGRLFGKINLLDLVVVLLVLGVAGRFAYKALQPQAMATAQGHAVDVSITLRFTPVTQPTANELKVGTEILDSKTGNLMGKVTDLQSKKATVVTYTSDGRLIEREADDLLEVNATVTGAGWETRDSITMGGFEVKVGRSLQVKTKRYAGTPVIVGLIAEPTK